MVTQIKVRYHEKRSLAEWWKVLVFYNSTKSKIDIAKRKKGIGGVSPVESKAGRVVRRS